MKCRSCDCILSDREAVRKTTVTQEFLDLCDDCFSYIKDEVSVVDSPKFSANEFLPNPEKED